MPEDSSQVNRTESFGSAANLMIEALEKASQELERTVSQCLDQLSSFTEGIDKSLAIQLEKVTQQSSHLVDSHGNELEAKRDETLDAISAIEVNEIDRMTKVAAAIRRRFADQLIVATVALNEIMEEQLSELATLIDTPANNFYELSQERSEQIAEMATSAKERIENISHSYEDNMSEKARIVDENAQKIIESAKAEVENRLDAYSDQFENKIELVQEQLGALFATAIDEIKALAAHGSVRIDECQETNHQVLNEHIDHWKSLLSGMKDRFHQDSIESQSRFLKGYNEEIEKKLVLSKDEINMIATTAKSRMTVNQKLVHNSLRRVERKLSDEVDRLFIKFQAALAQESKISLMASGTRTPASPEALDKMNSRLRAHGSELVKTFKRQVEQTEADFVRSAASSNERIESIRLSAVEALEKQVRVMRSDLDRITRNFHNELSELSFKLPMIEESGRAAALAVMAYRSAMLSLEND